jgi:hypothetical protein
MYVRWLKRELTRTTRFHGRHSKRGHALSAVLVESRRVAGSPRQRFVAHLATLQVWDTATGKGDVSIARGGLAYRHEAEIFWERVSGTLDAIGQAFDRDLVEARIAARVPRDPAYSAVGPSDAPT